MVNDLDTVLDPLTKEVKETGPDGQEVTKVIPSATPEIKDALAKNIRRRMTPQPMKFRADIEMKCFQFDGVLHIKNLIPPSYLEELSVLQDRITPFSNEVAVSTIEAELGLSIDKLFSEISSKPVAAASLGQVYCAILRSTGQVVAIKVQRPGVRAAIALDILILCFMAGIVRRAGNFNTDLQAVIDEWASSLFQEMDYSKEAENGLKFRIFKFSLENIDLSGEQSVYAEWLAYIGVFSYLHSLNLADCHRVTTASLWPITGLTSLKEIGLSRCAKFTDAGINHLLSIPQFEKLHISGTGVTDGGIRLLSSSLENLKSLDLGGCLYLTWFSVLCSQNVIGVILCAAGRATQVTLQAIQCLGGNGYVNEYPTGRFLRDAKLYEIGAGTSEIRRMIIGRELFKEQLRS